ncbi:DUF4992 family lipoprotein [Bacteroides finegoldii]|uniref:DUF4992 family lipoprotein n=1 Tax=Bacteroides finegoldii TaxID=338188 RepID=UPI00189DBF6D|nr:DUF4992 family lipoprotein [Bacteroides finegoldii]
MKSKMKIKIKLVESLWLLAMALFIVSCAKGVDDSETFSGGVTNAQLESPEEINFATTTNADGSENLKLSWSVVMGAGGYKVNVHNMNDPVNPVAVVTDSIIDGSSMSFAKLEDTNYHISVLTLGNKKLNNTDAQMATEKDYKAFEAVATIHEGESLAEYVNNDMPDFAQNLEQCIVLEPGVTYQLDAIADFGMNAVTLRGDVENRPTIVIGTDGGLVTQGGLKIKNVNFDCTAMTNQIGVVTLSDEPDASISAGALGYVDSNGNSLGTAAYIINNPIIFQGCHFTEIKNSLIYAGTKPWAISDFRIMNCIVELNSRGEQPFINFYGGGRAIRDLSIQNSTFYNLLATNSGTAYFIRLSNASNAQPQKNWGVSGDFGSVTIKNNTFYQTFSGKDFANNIPSRNTIKTTVAYNVFYNTYRVNKVFGSSNVKTYNNNYMYAVASGDGKIQDLDNTDKTTYGIVENPQFIGPVDNEPTLVNFAPANTTQIYENKAGDPRWYE